MGTAGLELKLGGPIFESIGPSAFIHSTSTLTKIQIKILVRNVLVPERNLYGTLNLAWLNEME